eukprot:TRINITY_DN1422_c0_g1_i2.p2 TRINITY_DN1422_c0_g1~~TRINITY_DN1422_c0_g1_i2.p2  ORF type:complete len:116 (-),score=1.53 TRINITY_DN1422_c0_g1_i2:234-581(-)
MCIRDSINAEYMGYMFHVPHTEKMQLAAAVKIDVRTQRDIEIKSHTTKRLPGQQQAIPKHSVSLLSRLQNSFLLNNKASLNAVESRYKSRAKKNAGQLGYVSQKSVTRKEEQAAW